MKRQRSYRGEKLGEEMRRIISELLARELKDPAFDAMISITHIKSADDGSFATVYFTSLGSDEAAVMEGFEKAKGYIRNEIGRRLGIRRSPELRFKLDETALRGRRIDTILSDLDLPDEEDSIGREVTFTELAEIIDAYERYLVFTHIHLDGDTLGAAVAFADAMREIGREAWVVVGDAVPRTLGLINLPFVIDADKAALLGFTEDQSDDDENDGEEGDEPAVPYLAVAMDFADSERLEGREHLFLGAEETLSIDHHSVSTPDSDYFFIDSAAAATSEIVFRLLKENNLPITERIATALYIGIVTDTGRFQYANTTPETHRIAAELHIAGADFVSAYRDLYQSIKAEKLFVQSAMLGTLDIFAGGKVAMAYVRADTLENLDAGEDETDGMSELLRGIIGVEVSVFLRERPDGKIKASMRSKGNLDVAEFAAGFGGGGHARAAGFTSGFSLEELLELLKIKLTEALYSASGE